MKQQQQWMAVVAMSMIGAGAVSVLGQSAAGSAKFTTQPAPAKASAAKTGALATPVKSGAAPWKRTPWGDPDLQGVWNDATATPLERPGRAGGNQSLTDNDAAEFEKESAFELTRDRRDGGAAADVRRAYNEHWMDARHLKITDKRTSLIYDPPDGRLPPLISPMSEERQAARKKRADQLARFTAGAPNDVEDNDVDGRCIMRTDIVPYLPAPYNNDFQIFQSPGYVVIAPEMIHSARIIPLDNRPPLGRNLPQYLGTTRGHFEGPTLVLETTNFFHEFDGRTFEGVNPKTYHVTERITRVDATTIDYDFTVNDPTTWAQPWSAKVWWTRVDPKEQMYEYACHEDNFDMVHFLSGARKTGK